MRMILSHFLMSWGAQLRIKGCKLACHVGFCHAGRIEKMTPITPDTSAWQRGFSPGCFLTDWSLPKSLGMQCRICSFCGPDIYIYMCVCVCVYIYIYKNIDNHGFRVGFRCDFWRGKLFAYMGYSIPIFRKIQWPTEHPWDMLIPNLTHYVTSSSNRTWPWEISMTNRIE